MHKMYKNYRNLAEATGGLLVFISLLNTKLLWVVANSKIAEKLP